MKKIAERKAELEAEIARLQAEEETLKKLEADEEMLAAVNDLGKQIKALEENKRVVRGIINKLKATVKPVEGQRLESFVKQYRENFERWPDDVDRAARKTVHEQLCWESQTHSGWQPHHWLAVVGLVKGYRARKARVERALRHVDTGFRGDDSHGDLVDCLALYLEDEWLTTLENNPQMWLDTLSKQREAYSDSKYLQCAVWVQKHIENGEKYLEMTLDDALDRYANSIEWEV